MSGRHDASAPETTYRCPPASRWLPHALAGAVLAAAALVWVDLDPARPTAATVRAVVLAAGAVLALGILRGGAETRLRVDFRGDALRLSHGGRSVEMRLADVEMLDWDPPLRSLTRWPPALVLVDRGGRRLRIPACVAGGPRLVEQILGRSTRASLHAWADARRVGERMARSYVWVALGWALAAAVLAAAVAFSAARPARRAHPAATVMHAAPAPSPTTFGTGGR